MSHAGAARDTFSTASLALTFCTDHPNPPPAALPFFQEPQLPEPSSSSSRQDPELETPSVMSPQGTSPQTLCSHHGTLARLWTTRGGHVPSSDPPPALPSKR